MKEYALKIINKTESQLYKQRDFSRMQLLVDSLGKAEVLSEAESYFWQGLAYYRMMQVHTAEARLRNDTNEAPEKKEKVVLKVTADAEKVVFTIEDTGIVIPPEEAEHINVSPSNG